VQFYGCAITVGPGVLIPRPETELLVDSIVKELSKQPLAEKKLLDLCCGSGCIAIAIKKALPELEVIASDISKEAVQYTTCNAEHNGVHIKILQGNLLEALHEKVNFLVCNPPYISEAEFQGLDASVKDFEPYVALVSGPTGLEVYQKIAATSRNYVTEKIWLEIGKDQGQLVKSLFQDAGYMNIHVEKDLSGHDRYIYI
jgi:release factor glutamine methyltransferase